MEVWGAPLRWADQDPDEKGAVQYLQFELQFALVASLGAVDGHLPTQLHGQCANQDS